MPEPEISRRCYYCGASMRERAAFCPQCGRALAGTPDFVEPSEVHDTEDAVRKDITLTEADFHKSSKPPAIAERAQPEPNLPEAPKPPTPDPTATAPLSKSVDVKESSKPVTQRVPSVGAKVHKATQRARDVQDHAMHRVHKVREISTVMIEEAGYDPSLRFILVAAALFVLFLLIMLLNKLIG